MNSPEPSATGLLISRDLFFSSKITGTAAELGFRVAVEGNVALAISQIAASPYRCVFLDLETPGLNVAEVIGSLPQTGRPVVMAFGSHVQTARLQEARDAGCDEVLPRSKFTATLPAILTRYLQA